MSKSKFLKSYEHLFLKSCEHNELDKVRQMLAFGVNVNLKRVPGEDTGLNIAAFSDFGELLELLLSQPRVDVNIANDFNETPLLWAFMKGLENIVRRLCQVNGIDPNI